MKGWGTDEGEWAIMLMQQSFLGWIVIGLIAGAVGKLVMPGKDPGGLVVTILVGIAGALLAGFVASALGWSIDSGWKSYAAATLGAIVLLGLYRLIVVRRV